MVVKFRSCHSIGHRVSSAAHSTTFVDWELEGFILLCLFGMELFSYHQLISLVNGVMRVFMLCEQQKSNAKDLSVNTTFL